MSEHQDQTTGKVITQFYRRSAEIKELFLALAKAQAMFSAAPKDGTGNFGKYATLESVIETTKEGRKENDLAIVQIPGNIHGNHISVTTILGHSSGQWIESTFAVPPTKFDAQGAGSVISYLRRYALMAVLGVAAEDDDGEVGSFREPSRQPAPRLPSRRDAPPLRRDVPNRPEVRPNGSAVAAPATQSSNGAMNPDDGREDALKAYDRLLNAIGTAKSPSEVNDLLFRLLPDGTDEDTDDFKLVAAHNDESADHIIKYAKARKQELRASE